MKKITIILLFLNILNISAQNHLVPIPDVFSYNGFTSNYQIKLNNYLCEGLAEQNLARIIVAPSFSPEYIVSIENKKDENYIFFRTYEKPIHLSTEQIDKGLVRKIEYKKMITNELADLLREIIFEATSKVRYPQNEYFITPSGRKSLKFFNINDGEIYYFVSSLYGPRRAGQTHSPREDSIAGELVKLARLMKAASYDPKVNEQLYEFGSRLLIKVKTS